MSTLSMLDSAGVRARYCDSFEQASHRGECAADDVTAFDSTGLALQDLATALVALERTSELDLPRIDL